MEIIETPAPRPCAWTWLAWDATSQPTSLTHLSPASEEEGLWFGDPLSLASMAKPRGKVVGPRQPWSPPRARSTPWHGSITFLQHVWVEVGPTINLVQ